MPELLRMPAVAANTDAATLASWSVTENEPYRASDIIAIVETAKAAVEIEAPSPGKIVRFLVPDGTDVAVGDAIALLAAPDEQVSNIDAALRALGLMSGTSTRHPPALGGEAAPPAPAALATPSGRTFASPLARRMARDSGLDFTTVHGSGPNGRIVRADVEAALRSEAKPILPADVDDVPANPAAARASVPLEAAGELVPHTRLRREIARRLTASKASAPHFYVRGSAHVDALLAMRKQLNAAAPVKISVNDLVVKAVAAAYQQVPVANVIWDDAGMRGFADVDLGIAVATEGGLVTPVLRGVQRLSITEVARLSGDLATRAREGRLRPDQLEGAVATISNLGMFGTEEFAAIINPPQSAILAVGAARPEPVVVDGALAIATVMRVTVSVDHRAIDGAVAAQWLEALLTVLAEPARMFA